MVDSYWVTVRDKRLSRRRALAAAGGMAVGTAILSACGGGSDEESDKSSLLGKRENTTSKAVRGGVWPRRLASNGSLDPSRNSGLAQLGFISPVYNTLFKFALGEGDIPKADTIKGDSVSAWEVSSDGTVITAKIRPNHRFDPRPPTNGRAMTAEDVVYSWQRTSKLSPLLSDINNANNPAGPLESISAVDHETISIKLAFPYAAALEALSFYYLYIMPMEAEDKFDAQLDARGSGPFMLTSYILDGASEFKRRDDWYEKDRPFLDGFINHNIPEPAAALDQFEVGSLWTYEVPQNQVVRVKRDHPEMVLLRGLAPSHRSPTQNSDMTYSLREDSPFKDVRLRQAATYLYDADAYMNAMFNIDEFVSQGLPFETQRNSHIAVQCSNWIDPRAKEFGSNSKYFEYNPEEAKKLISAAGGVPEFTFLSWNLPGQFSQTAQIVAGMWEQGGLKVNHKPQDNPSWFALKRDGPGAYNGIYQGSTQGYNDDSHLGTKYLPSGKERVIDKAYPGVSDVVTKLRGELDLKKRDAMINELQKEILPPLMFDFAPDSDQRSFVIFWPWLKNFETFSLNGFSDDASSARPYTEYWYDDSLRKKSS